MPLTTKDIEKFRALYLREYGVNLSDAEAYTKASRLLRLFRAICLPDVSASNAQKSQSEQTNHENARDHEWTFPYVGLLAFSNTKRKFGCI